MLVPQIERGSSAGETLTNRFNQRRRHEWLLKEAHALTRNETLTQHLPRVTTREHHAERRLFVLKLAREVCTLDAARHDHVRQQQADSIFVFVPDGERRLSRLC